MEEKKNQCGCPSMSREEMIETIALRDIHREKYLEKFSQLKNTGDPVANDIAKGFTNPFLSIKSLVCRSIILEKLLGG